ncbi:histidine kinase [Saccharopolyspora erythraea]|uniref:sensor histidine kinase n=1 Tax=Saccharopolyspora erythraea TaxID=1836 RepID=UPI001BAC1B12|nr:histidine kinase [Saccharopolyspora erythraea]QUH00433.1 histidine kinase [Saccharopolyspora erythraea]
MKRPLWRLLWNSRREAVFDIALVAALEVVGRLLLHLFPEQIPPQSYEWIGGRDVSAVLTDLTCLLLLARRRFPLLLMSFFSALTLAQVLLVSYGPGPLLPLNDYADPWIPGELPCVVYGVVVYPATRLKRLVGWNLIALVIFLAARLWNDPPVELLASAFLLTAFPAVLGLYVGARRRLEGALRDRAERAEREQHLLAEQARADERARLAAEMHDVVTHRVSLMVLQAGALGVAAKDGQTREAAEQLRASGCEALAELRDLVGVLRRAPEEEPEYEDPETTAVPDLADLISRSEAAGVPVELVEEGDYARVSPAVGRTAHRVVQEALTNVYKHAPGSQVRVDAVYGERVRLTVRNTASPHQPSADLAGSGSGTGLLGLRQRVDLVGGTLRAGAMADGGFQVDVILPAYVPTAEAADE